MMTHMAATPSLVRTLHTSLKSHKGPVNTARYSKGSAKYVLTAGQDRTVRLWNAALGTEIKVFAGHGYEVLSACVCVRCCIAQICVLTSTIVLMIMLHSHPAVVIAQFSCGMWLPESHRGDSADIWAKSTPWNSMRTRRFSLVVSLTVTFRLLKLDMIRCRLVRFLCPIVGSKVISHAGL